MSVVKNRNYLTNLEKIFEVEIEKISTLYELLVGDRHLGREKDGSK
jgi:hypothetical protein